MTYGFGLVSVGFRGVGVLCLVVYSLLVAVGFGCVVGFLVW